jgi:hypothetical protein
VETIPIKQIVTHGGQVRFRIPTEWTAEYDENGNGEFYLPGTVAPTLRLDLVSLKSPSQLDTHSFTEILRADADQIEILNDRTAMRSYSNSVDDRGNKLRIHYWEVANLMPPKHARLAIFSLTLLEDDVLDPEMNKLATLFDDEIHRCEFNS